MPVRERLALIVVRTLCLVWTVYMVAAIWRHEPVSVEHWAILPSGTGALLAALGLVEKFQQGRHRKGS